MRLESRRLSRRCRRTVKPALLRQKPSVVWPNMAPMSLRKSSPPTFWERSWNQLTDFVVIILLVAAVVSSLLGDWIEAAVIMAIVVLNSAIGVIQESKAEEALAALKKMAAPDAQVIRDGSRVTVPARELVVGDIVLLEAGSIVPADLRLTQSMNLKLEEASLTGESVPVNKYAEHVIAHDAGIGDRHNMAYMSTVVTYGRGQGTVVATGMGTEIGKIAEMIQSVEGRGMRLLQKQPTGQETLGIGSLATVGRQFWRLNVYAYRYRHRSGELVSIRVSFIAVSLAIAAVPEGLAADTICLALGMREMGGNGYPARSTDSSGGDFGIGDGNLLVQARPDANQTANMPHRADGEGMPSPAGDTSHCGGLKMDGTPSGLFAFHCCAIRCGAVRSAMTRSSKRLLVTAASIGRWRPHRGCDGGGCCRGEILACGLPGHLSEGQTRSPLMPIASG